ncbi:hypothetical protein H4R18_001691 [Coemansia javaensis]|uniref:Siderophore synthetase component n=1 Tax=Coemansia javaensis TaxID=2761396 RepID=A0A9W8HBY7_9FUNG|nr:hypothetical protein H4R18_001691 [Coemansia javaensis]
MMPSNEPPALCPSAPSHAQRALFATVSRLLACLVNERLVDAYCVDRGGADSKYLLVVRRGSDPGACGHEGSVASQLCHRPVVGGKPLTTGIGAAAAATPVRLLDPEDLGAHQWLQRAGDEPAELVSDPGQIMALVGRWNGCGDADIAGVCAELASSVAHQTWAYAHRRPEPDILASAAVEWEQSIVEGHATHPMHRTRYAVPPLEPLGPATELMRLRLAFVAVPRREMKVEGAFEAMLAPLYSHAAPDCAPGGSPYILDHVDRAQELVVPVHPLHLPAVLAKFPFARRLPFSVPAAAQASLRTVVPEIPEPYAYDIKLPLGLKTSSALRTVSPWSTFVGPRVTEAIPHILRGAPVEGALLIAGEPASAVSADPDYDVAKYLSCIVREAPEQVCRPLGERVIVAAALTERSEAGESAAVRHWALATEAQRREFLRAYMCALFDAFLPPIMSHGFAFEAHPQNTLLRVDAQTGAIRGFIVRDFGGIKVHRDTFRRSIGVDIDMLPDSCTDAATMHEVYDLAHHTLIQCQAHRLVRALGLHYRGGGWAIVRRAFEQRVPADHPLRLAWYQPQFDLKSFVTMKLGGLYRHYAYVQVPNVLFYRSEDDGVVFPPAD